MATTTSLDNRIRWACVVTFTFIVSASKAIAGFKLCLHQMENPAIDGGSDHSDMDNMKACE